jgi:F-type H+-transporting ATPase subunit epsilon
VIVLADAAERAEEIDVSRAEAAMKRAQESLSQRAAGTDMSQIEAALRRALVRIEVADKRRKKRQ